MKFRYSLIIGFAAGYYAGSRAGTTGYDQLRNGLEHLRDSRIFDRLQAVVELGVERMRQDDGPHLRVIVLDEDIATPVR
ncbi:MAG: hypothetical protein F2894_06065 [Actinobacteria bacterium]|uniref:Unannotated protein n=1 Tax=freshwater metagenome TaxID=449393 RepID=A0A6J7QYV7_9ZZZZ|nr:hypothetical protein [Actinomycetota bacterium]MSX33028.1 hypothetical protein [Actinomycetota bacterium]MSY06940.1 hypothetical protein [Actinomycetota bacterium]MSZ29834.1 hypothetical protein [Actinomycetota bacterium]